MKTLRIIGLVFSLLTAGFSASAQKPISEGTIVYDMEIQVGSTLPQKGDALDGASTTVYLKGSSSRTEMVSALGNETVIHDAKTGKAAILKSFSGQKLMITLTKEDWMVKNKANSDIKFDLENETRTIAGFTCKKAVAKLADGRNFVVFYAPDLVPANREYDPTFTNLPGLAVEYVIETPKMKFKYTLSKISFDPVLVSRFDFPKSGYRVMTYEENQQLKKGNQ